MKRLVPLAVRRAHALGRGRARRKAQAHIRLLGDEVEFVLAAEEPPSDAHADDIYGNNQEVDDAP